MLVAGLGNLVPLNILSEDLSTSLTASEFHASRVQAFSSVLGQISQQVFFYTSAKGFLG